MPRYYRDQHKKWKPGDGSIVMEVLPHDLSTLNLMPPGPLVRVHPDASITLAAFKVNRILAAILAGDKQ